MTSSTSTETFAETITNSYEYFDDDGATYRVFECVDDHKYDRFVIRFDVDDGVPFQMRLYEDESDTPNEKIAFERRDVQFDPISVIGKGSSNRLQGVSPTIDAYNDVPCIVQEAWKAIGFTVVPDGDEWSV